MINRYVCISDFYASCFLEIKEVIHKEIPERNDTDGQQFREIEIEFQLVVEEIYGCIVDEQADDGDADESGILPGNLGVVALKRPDAVEQIVACRRTHKADGVGHIFVDAADFFEEPRQAEIDKDARAADDAEFDELKNHSLLLVRKNLDAMSG